MSGNDAVVELAATASAKDFQKALKATGGKRYLKDLQGRPEPTPYHKAAETGNLPVLKHLLSKYKEQLSLNQADKSGWTALHSACYFSQLETIKVLIDAGANIHAVTNDFNTPLHYLVRNEDVVGGKELLYQTLDLLLSRGSNVNARNSNGETPLHAATMKDRVNVVRYLLKNGALVNNKNNFGETALHLAVRRANEAMVKELLMWGADPSTGGKDGTPLAIASELSLTSIVELITAHQEEEKRKCAEAMRRSLPVHSPHRTNSEPAGMGVSNIPDKAFPHPRTVRLSGGGYDGAYYTSDSNLLANMGARPKEPPAVPPRTRKSGVPPARPSVPNPSLRRRSLSAQCASNTSSSSALSFSSELSRVRVQQKKAMQLLALSECSFGITEEEDIDYISSFLHLLTYDSNYERELLYHIHMEKENIQRYELEMEQARVRAGIGGGGGGAEPVMLYSQSSPTSSPGGERRKGSKPLPPAPAGQRL
ncbi:Amyloid protein-binding protein 2 [Balamuthia mandrillaris]